MFGAMNPVVIGPPHGLRISDYDATRATVEAELVLPGLTATTTTYEYTERPHPLVGYFQDLAEHWRGWKGSKEFESLEGDLHLSARHDGHIVVTATLRTYLEPAEWTAIGEFRLDPGEELSAIAAALENALA
jgi:hypothetical protein